MKEKPQLRYTALLRMLGEPVTFNNDAPKNRCEKMNMMLRSFRNGGLQETGLVMPFPRSSSRLVQIADLRNFGLPL